MIDPEAARKVLREYQATTPIEEQVEDVLRWSPALAERLGLNEPFVLALGKRVDSVRSSPRSEDRSSGCSPD